MYAVSLDSSLARRVQGNLERSSERTSGAVRQLSSGLRINSAKDDAAGAAIAEKMTSRVRGFDQARRNANDGVSLVQTAEGSLSKATNLLQRIRELAVQSANATNSAGDRQALNSEASQLVSELDRIAKTTEFNGQVLLDGSFGTQQLQVGANESQMIAVPMLDARANSLGANTFESGAGVITAGSA